MALNLKYDRTGANVLNDIPRLRAQFVSKTRYTTVSFPVVAMTNNPYDTGLAILDKINAKSAMKWNKTFNTLDTNDDHDNKLDFPDDPGDDLADQFIKFKCEKNDGSAEPYIKSQMVPAMIGANAAAKQALADEILTILNGDVVSGWTWVHLPK